MFDQILCQIIATNLTLNSHINPCSATCIVPSSALYLRFLTFKTISALRTIPSNRVPDIAVSLFCPVVFENFDQASLPFLSDIVQHMHPSY